jgi:hypothetical protein
LLPTRHDPYPFLRLSLAPGLPDCLFFRREAGNVPGVRFAALVVACAACLGLTACGGDDEETASPGTTSAETIPADEYARRADELCGQVVRKVLAARIQQRLTRIEQTRTTKEQQARLAAPVLAEQLQLISEFRRQVEELGLPSEHRDDAERLLEKTRSAEDELEQAVASARVGDSEATLEAIGRYAGLSSQSASIARDSELNFAICGAGA